MDSADGALALLLLLDQFPRNCFRGSGHAYATDPLARRYATRAVDAGFDTQVDPALRVFVYLPFEHSEDMADQLRCIELTRALDPERSEEQPSELQPLMRILYSVFCFHKKKQQNN